jgi:hypothetical protein
MKCMDNCGSCSIALDRTLGGVPTQAIDSGPMTEYMVAKEYNMLGFSSYRGGIPEIEYDLLQAGPGSRGIVHGVRGLDAEGQPIMGHFFNAVNQDGKIVFLDAQSGTFANLNDGFTSFRFLRTNR